MKLKGLIAVLIILIIGIFGFNSFTFTTQENEYAVVKEFGKITDTYDSAGLRFKIPFIQNITYIPKSIQLYDLNLSEVITSDKKTMIVDAYVLWKVKDAKVYTSSLNASNSTAQSRLDVIVFNAIKTTVSSMTQDEVIKSRNGYQIEIIDTDLEDLEINDYTELSEQETDIGNISISDKLLECIGDQPTQYGLEILDVEIKMLDLPEENKAAVYERMITERNNIATAYRAQGESAAQIIRNTTDAEVSVMISEAEANAEKIIAEGEAEYMRILSEAYNDPGKADFYLFSLQLESLRDSLSREDNLLILGEDSPFASIFNGIGQ